MENFGSLILPLLLSARVGYLLGSISFAILLTKAFAHEDVRAHGSGNAGATNVLRVAGKKASALTFLLDFCKCVASVLVGYFLVKHACVANGVDPEMARLGMYAAGFCCMIGHMYPLYFGFRLARVPHLLCGVPSGVPEKAHGLAFVYYGGGDLSRCDVLHDVFCGLLRGRAAGALRCNGNTCGGTDRRYRYHQAPREY